MIKFSLIQAFNLPLYLDFWSLEAGNSFSISECNNLMMTASVTFYLFGSWGVLVDLFFSYALVFFLFLFLNESCFHKKKRKDCLVLGARKPKSKSIWGLAFLFFNMICCFPKRAFPISFATLILFLMPF